MLFPRSLCSRESWREFARDRVLLLLIAPRWPGRVWFPDLISLLDGPPLVLPIRKDLLSQAGGSIFHPQPELWKLWALASEGAQLMDSGLSTEVVETILHFRAPSTRKMYALKWKVFTFQLTAQSVQCWSSCKIGSLQG